LEAGVNEMSVESDAVRSQMQSEDVHVYTTENPDGTCYKLPPGINLENVEPDKIQLAIQVLHRRDEAFSEGPLHLGSCSHVPLRILLKTQSHSVSLIAFDLGLALVAIVIVITLCGLIKSVEYAQRNNWPDMIQVFMNNTAFITICITILIFTILSPNQ
jgi:hypothetical protein